MLNKNLLIGSRKHFTPITIVGTVERMIDTITYNDKVGIGRCISDYPQFKDTPINVVPVYSSNRPYKWDFAIYLQERNINPWHVAVLPYASYVGIKDIVVTVDGVTATFYNQFDDEYTTSMDIGWELPTKIGQNIRIELDPPPDGYLDPETLKPI